MEETNRGAYFQPLTGIRAVAAFMVFIVHYNPFSEQSPVHDFVSELYVGVTLFFVLSGFLITYRYFDSKDFSFRVYMVNRIARIYPMYFLLTLATFIVYAFAKNGESGFALFFLNISFLRGFFDDFKFTGIPQGWSLTVEETFYFVAPLLFVILRRSKFFLLVLPIAILMVGFGLVYLFSGNSFHSLFASNDFMFNYTFFGRCFEFFFGMGLAVLIKKGIPEKKNFHFTFIGIIVILISIYLLSIIKGSYRLGIDHPIGKLINSFLLPSGTCFLFYGLISEQTFVSKILGSKFFVLLGRSSYVFYLIHVGIIATSIQALGENVIVIFIVINIISILLFRYVEEPLNRLVRRKL